MFVEKLCGQLCGQVCGWIGMCKKNKACKIVEKACGKKSADNSSDMLF